MIAALERQRRTLAARCGRWARLAGRRSLRWGELQAWLRALRALGEADTRLERAQIAEADASDRAEGRAYVGGRGEAAREARALRLRRDTAVLLVGARGLRRAR